VARLSRFLFLQEMGEAEADDVHASDQQLGILTGGERARIRSVDGIDSISTLAPT
jgi:hypothetical protein